MKRILLVAALALGASACHGETARPAAHAAVHHPHARASHGKVAAGQATLPFLAGSSQRTSCVGVGCPGLIHGQLFGAMPQQPAAKHAKKHAAPHARRSAASKGPAFGSGVHWPWQHAGG